MNAHELPPDAQDLTPEAAQEAINRINADARGDPAHPLNLRDHPQHGDFLRRTQGLYSAANPTPEPAEPLDVGERADLTARLKKIEAVPGFMTGELRARDRASHDRLVKERFEVYEKLHPEPVEVEDDTEPAPDDDPAGTVLRQQAEAENERLVELGYPAETLPADVPPHLVTALKLRRLSAEGDDAGFRKLLESEFAALGVDENVDLQSDLRDDLIRRFYHEAQRRADG